MKIRSIKTNFILNAFRALSGGVITIAIMPYINRVLGPEMIGKVEYVYTILNYFILFSALGIPLYGIREIARIRENERERSKTTLELLFVLAITTVISYCVFFGVLYQFATFENYKPLLLVMSSMILLSNMGAEWYFQGIEDQLYITVRYVIVRLVVIAIIFLGIKNEGDYVIYAFTLVLTLCGSNIFNFFFLLKKLKFNFNEFYLSDIKKHIKPIFTIFIATISVNIYLQLDNFLIGFLVGDKFVGYYSVSNKLIRFGISFITIIGTVMLPRLSNLYSSDLSQYYKLLKKSFNIILIISIPTSIIFLIYSREIINVMAGNNFQPSILTMQILSPLCIVVGIAYFFGYLLLYPQNKEKIYTKAVVASAIFSVIINIFAIKLYYQNGAATIAVISEILAIVIIIFLAKKEVKDMKLVDNNLFKIITSAAIVLMISFLIRYHLDLTDLFLFYGAIVSPYFLFFIFLLFMKEITIIDLFNKGLVTLKINK